jgi:hypothetical protein
MGGIAIVLAALAASAPNAAAQDVRRAEAPQVYVRTGYAWLNQADGMSDCPYLCNPLGGVSNAISFAVGGRLSDRFSLSGDLTVGAVLEMQQSARTPEEQTSTKRATERFSSRAQAGGTCHGADAPCSSRSPAAGSHSAASPAPSRRCESFRRVPNGFLT